MTTIEQMASAICTARDFCGNEREAAKTTCEELGVQFTLELYAEALKLAEKWWMNSIEAAKREARV